MDPTHRRLAQVGLHAAARFGFALAGGYAVQEHGLIQALTEFLASGAPRSIEHQLQVTVRLSRWALRQTRGGPAAGEPVLQLRIELVDSEDPVIWRQVLVPAGSTSADLHTVIQAAMGWQDAHLHQFRAGDRCYGPSGTDLDLIPEDGVRLDQIIATDAEPGTQAVLDYLYDFGDDWEHQMSVGAVTAADPDSRYPRCTGGQGACPPRGLRRDPRLPAPARPPRRPARARAGGTARMAPSRRGRGRAVSPACGYLGYPSKPPWTFLAMRSG